MRWTLFDPFKSSSHAPMDRAAASHLCLAAHILEVLSTDCWGEIWRLSEVESNKSSKTSIFLGRAGMAPCMQRRGKGEGRRGGGASLFSCKYASEAGWLVGWLVEVEEWLAD